MTQLFTILISVHSQDPDQKFFWCEEDENGYEKYGFIHCESISTCLKQIEKEIDEAENDFEITIDVSDKYGGKSTIHTLNELSFAKIRYTSFSPSN